MLDRRQRIQKIVKRLKLRLRGTSGQGHPLFLCGAQRSGTNMLLDTIDRNPATECYNETDEEAFDNYVLRGRAVTQSLLQQSYAQIVVFKCICDSQHARRLLHHFPTGRVVWIYRDYRDVVNSALRQFSEHNQYLHYILHEPAVARWRAENIDEHCLRLIRHHYARQLSEASARALIWYLRNYQYFQQDLPNHAASRLVRYEEFVQSTRIVTEMFRWLHLDFDASWCHFLSQKSIRRHEPPAIDPEIADLCEDLTARLDSACAAQVSVAGSIAPAPATATA
jgi:hypothetical protein